MSILCLRSPNAPFRTPATQYLLNKLFKSTYNNNKQVNICCETPYSPFSCADRAQRSVARIKHHHLGRSPSSSLSLTMWMVRAWAKRWCNWRPASSSKSPWICCSSQSQSNGGPHRRVAGARISVRVAAQRLYNRTLSPSSMSYLPQLHSLRFIWTVWVVCGLAFVLLGHSAAPANCLVLLCTPCTLSVDQQERH